MSSWNGATMSDAVRVVRIHRLHSKTAQWQVPEGGRVVGVWDSLDEAGDPCVAVAVETEIPSTASRSDEPSTTSRTPSKPRKRSSASVAKSTPKRASQGRSSASQGK